MVKTNFDHVLNVQNVVNRSPQHGKLLFFGGGLRSIGDAAKLIWSIESRLRIEGCPDFSHARASSVDRVGEA